MKEIEQQLGLIVIAIGLCFIFLYTSDVGQARREQEIAQLQGEHPSWSRALCNEVARGRISEGRVEKHPAWPWALIVERKIKPGMTEEMVRLSWGSPTSRPYRSVSLEGTYEVWIYDSADSLCFKDGSLYFKNGILFLWVSR